MVCFVVTHVLVSQIKQAKCFLFFLQFEPKCFLIVSYVGFVANPSFHIATVYFAVADVILFLNF